MSGNKDKAEGKLDQAAGKLKEEAGDALVDKEMETEGQGQQV